MRIAHLILANKNPEQLKRLVQRLVHHNADIYIHLDAKSDITLFNNIGKIPGVIFINKRVKVYWASFNMVLATVNAFKEILNSGVEYGYINLLSGQDYPLKSAEELYRFLTNNPGKIFMDCRLAHSHWKEALNRVEKYHLTNYNFPGANKLQNWINRIMPLRKLPNGLVLVGRSQWFTIAPKHVRYFLAYWDTHSIIRQFIKLTWAPDEFIFQTILYNSPHKDNIINDNLRYIDWSDGGASPKILTIENADTLVNSGKFFARKFDIDVDSDILDYIDNYLNSKPTVALFILAGAALL